MREVVRGLGAVRDRRGDREARGESPPAETPKRFPLYVGATDGGSVFAPAEAALLVLGPPRSGKTTSLVVPNVLVAPGAVVSTSTKLDVLEATLAHRRRLGPCFVFDPSGSVPLPPGAEALRWSPVAGSGSFDGALVMARALVQAASPGRGVVGESHWTERAEALLAPLLHAAALNGAPIGVVAGWVHRHELAEAFGILEAAGATVALEVLTGIAATEERERSGIFSTAAGSLSVYRSEAARRAAVEPTFDPAAFVRSSGTLYVAAPARAQELVAPLVVALVEEVCSAAFARTGGPPVLFALDEVARIAPLPQLPGLVAEGGGQGVLVLACLQDLSQARVRWGEAASGFLSLFGAKLVLPGIGDLRTLEAVSALCGEVDVAVRSVTGPARTPVLRRWRRAATTTVSTRKERRLPVDALARGEARTAVYLAAGRPAFRVRLTPWYEDARLRGLAAGGRERSEPGGSAILRTSGPGGLRHLLQREDPVVRAGPDERCRAGPEPPALAR